MSTPPVGSGAAFPPADVGTPYAQSTSQRVVPDQARRRPRHRLDLGLHQELRTTDAPAVSGSNLDKSTIRPQPSSERSTVGRWGRPAGSVSPSTCPTADSNWPASGNWYDLMDLHNTVGDWQGTMVHARDDDHGLRQPRYLAFQTDGMSAEIPDYEEAKPAPTHRRRRKPDASSLQPAGTPSSRHQVLRPGHDRQQPPPGTIYFDGNLALGQSATDHPRGRDERLAPAPELQAPHRSASSTARLEHDRLRRRTHRLYESRRRRLERSAPACPARPARVETGRASKPAPPNPT